MCAFVKHNLSPPPDVRSLSISHPLFVQLRHSACLGWLHKYMVFLGEKPCCPHFISYKSHHSPRVFVLNCSPVWYDGAKIKRPCCVVKIRFDHVGISWAVRSMEMALF